MDYLELYNFISCEVTREKFTQIRSCLIKHDAEQEALSSFAEEEIAWKIKDALKLAGRGRLHAEFKNLFQNKFWM